MCRYKVNFGVYFFNYILLVFMDKVFDFLVEFGVVVWFN